MRRRGHIHAAAGARPLSTAAIFRQPSVLRNLICPLATRLKRRTSAASSLGSEPCVFTRRRNSSWSRSITFVVRSIFHCALGKLKNVRGSHLSPWGQRDRTAGCRPSQLGIVSLGTKCTRVEQLT